MSWPCVSNTTAIYSHAVSPGGIVAAVASPGRFFFGYIRTSSSIRSSAVGAASRVLDDSRSANATTCADCHMRNPKIGAK